MSRKHLDRFGLAVLAALTLAGPAAIAAQALTGAGATFPNPIYTKWFDAYSKKTGVQINYQSIGSGGGIQQFTQGTVDFGASDGPMTNDQMNAVQGDVIHFPTVMGADVITWNLPRRSAATKLKFDGPTIAGIYLGNDHQVERCPHRGNQSRRQAAERRHHRGAPVRRVGNVVHLHRLPEQGFAGVEAEGRRRHGRELAGRTRRQGQRRRDPAGQAGRRHDRIRRADLCRRPTSCRTPMSRTPPGTS